MLVQGTVLEPARTHRHSSTKLANSAADGSSNSSFTSVRTNPEIGCGSAGHCFSASASGAEQVSRSVRRPERYQSPSCRRWATANACHDTASSKCNDGVCVRDQQSPVWVGVGDKNRPWRLQFPASETWPIPTQSNNNDECPLPCESGVDLALQETPTRWQQLTK